MHLNGSFDESAIAAGYGQLLEQVSATDNEIVFVDTSKSLSYLEPLMAAWRLAGNSLDDILVVVVAKDPRGFAFSIQRKLEQRGTNLTAIRSMNWWNGTYRRLLACAESDGLSVVYVTYDQICKRPTEVLQRLARRLRRSFVLKAEISHARSHIALGNKAFIERNRERTCMTKCEKVVG